MKTKLNSKSKQANRRAKISLLLVLAIVLIAPTFQSCKKYPDGPMFSIHTRTQRVSNTWKVENYKINGSDYTSFVSSYTEIYSKTGTYSYIWGMANGSGTWAFQNDDKEIRLSGNDGQSSRVLTILKLEEKSFWYTWMDGNDKHELHLLPK